LIDTQTEAERGYERFLTSNPEWAAKFQLLEARALIWRGLSADALHVLAARPSVFKNNETIIESLTLAATAYTHLDMVPNADQKLREAQKLCEPAIYAACGGVILRGGYLALGRSQLAEARRLFLESLSFARAHHDQWSETSALQNLGWTAVQEERFDEAVDWSWSAYNSALKLGAEALAENALGNVGWAYYKLGDWDKG